MRVVAVVLTRNQAELADAVVAFHLAAGVDFVIALDHSSTDGTVEVLERWEGRGLLRLVRREGTALRLRRGELVHLAREEHGADWVIHPDGDEFWWPRHGSWKPLLGALPPRFGVVRGAWRHFAPRPEATGHFAERLVVRVSPSAARTTEDDPFHSGAKVAHRASPHVALRRNAHDAEIPGRVPLRGWYPFEILHFPLRTREQGREKYLDLASGLSEGALPVPPHVRRAEAEIAAGGWERAYDELVVDDEALEAGLASGALAVDTRLRDALRALAGVAELRPEQHFPVPPQDGRSLSFARAGLQEATAYLEDVQPLLERESDRRVRRRAVALERRIGALERTSLPALGVRAFDRALRRGRGRAGGRG